MKIAIMQPTFLPWLGYFAMINEVDCFVFLDSVQFERRSWQCRNKIKLENKEHFISLSCQKAPQQTLLKDIKLCTEQKYKDKILKTLYHAYHKTYNFEKYINLLQIKLNEYENLSSLNIALIKEFCKDLGIKTPLFLSSKLNLAPAKRENLLLQICQYFNATHYLSPKGSKNYLEKEYSREIFAQNDIKISYFNFNHPIYEQVGKEFISYLGVIDFLFNVKNPKNAFESEMGGGIWLYLNLMVFWLMLKTNLEKRYYESSF